MLKNAALVCALMGVSVCAHADKTPPPKSKPPVTQVKPNQASLHSFSVGSTNASGTASNAGGTGISKGTGTNGLGTGGGSGKVVEKSSASNLKKAGKSQPPPASSHQGGSTTQQQMQNGLPNPALNFTRISPEGAVPSSTGSDDVAPSTSTNTRPASSLVTGASSKPQVKAPTRQPHPN
jgi:hypothetical protein